MTSQTDNEHNEKSHKDSLPRKEEIYRLYTINGLTTTQIAYRYNLTRQRIGQILLDYKKELKTKGGDIYAKS